MGYTTEFRGQFDFDKPLDDKTFELLQGLSSTRRMARNVEPEFGVQGEFYVGKGYAGQDREDNIIDYNRPPSPQPSLWLQWVPTDDRLHLEWDGSEKFYEYVEWLRYLITRILAPRGYVLNGEVDWRGEDWEDNGTIVISANVVTTRR